jgi:hypothetical protein
MFRIFDRHVLEFVFQVEKGHTSFSHAFMQLGIAFFSQLKKYTLLLKVWQLLAP